MAVDLQRQVGPGKWKAPLWVWIALGSAGVLWHYMGAGGGSLGAALGGSGGTNQVKHGKHGTQPQKRKG